MAHWISSKLKAAETLLQQIDGQAAESLGKSYKPQQDDQLLAEDSPRTSGAKPLIKDQFKKKLSENLLSQTLDDADQHILNSISRSNSDINRDDHAKAPTHLDNKSNVGAGLTDSDWTKLLSVPDKKVGGVNRSSNVVSGIRGLRKDAKKGGSSGSGTNFPALSGRTERGRNNGVSKNMRKSNVALENNANTDSEERASNSGDVTPRISDVQSPSSGGDSDRVGSSCTVTNVTRNEEVNGITDAAKLHTADDLDNSSRTIPTSHEKKLDLKVGLKDNEMLKSGKGARSGSTVRSKIFGSMKKVSSLPSVGESNSETDTTSSSDSESEREREERRIRRQQFLAEKAAAKAVEAIKERENLVARLEGEKQSLEKILEEQAKQQVQEASELQSTMMETMDAVDLEKQKHNNTRMEALARLTRLERTNADLARSLAHIQKNLEIKIDHVAELRGQIHLKEATQEELRRKISRTRQKVDKLLAPKGAEFELEMLETEYSFITDKVGRMSEKAKTLETSIETIRREIEDPTEVEIELKRRLSQLTDHLIQKQAQVETLSSEKATLHFRIEAVSRLLDENKSMSNSTDLSSSSFRDDLESSMWQLSNSKLRPLLKERMQSGQQQLGSLVRQLDSLYCAGAVFIRRNSTAKIWALIYLVCLHLWVMYILISHSPVSEDGSGAVVSLDSINNTGAV